MGSGDFYFSTGSQNDSVSSLGSFGEAIAFSIDPEGVIYVLDGATNTLKKLSNTGDSVAQIGGYGWAELAFDQPADVFTPNGLDVYVADYGNHRIQRFDRNLNFGSSLSLRDNENVSQRFGYPQSVALSRQGALFIVDGENTRILKVSSDRTVERVFGGLDAGKGRLNAPKRVRVDNNDRVYVQDGNHLVMFDVFGNYIRTIGKNIFRQLKTFTIDQYLLYILDSCAIYILHPNGTIGNRIDFSSTDDDMDDCPAVDLAVFNKKLFLLTEHHIYILNLERE